MQITGFEVLTIEIPMRMSVDHALAKRTVARNVVVRAIGDGLEGWGESCPRPYVTGETVESVKRDLAETIVPRLVGRDLPTLEAARAHLTGILDEIARNQQAAFCSAELAVLDLVGKATGESAGEIFGPQRAEKARYSGVLATTEPKSVAKYCTLMKQFGVSEVKVKTVAELETNRTLLETAREILGPEIRLRLDANAAWDGAEAIRQLEALASFELEGVEQPCPADDLESMKEVTAAKLVPVVADESLASLDDARTLVAEKGCDVFNVRVSKCGGLINSDRIHRLGQEAGLKSQLGAQVGETGILSAAGRQFATRCEPIWCEGSYGSALLEEDITDPDVTVGPGGFAPAITAPGLGVVPIPARIQARTIETLSLP